MAEYTVDEIRALLDGATPGPLNTRTAQGISAYADLIAAAPDLAAQCLALIQERDEARERAEAAERERDRAFEELRQGWPKLAYDANRAAVEAMNQAEAAGRDRDEAQIECADALREIDRLRAVLARIDDLAEDWASGSDLTLIRASRALDVAADREADHG